MIRHFFLWGWSRLIQFGVTASVAFVAYRYLADFTLIQSSILTLLSMCVVVMYWTLLSLARRSSTTIAPFRVSVMPYWAEIHKDHELLTENEWNLLADSNRTPRSRYSVFYDGFNFITVTDKLSYSYDNHTFFSELDFVIEIQEVASGNLFEFSPSMYIRRSVNRKSASIAVIELGIIKRGRLGDKIPLAFLPISVFYDYFVPNAERGMSSKARAEAAAHLAMFNWKQRERELEYSEEPFLVDHKYFSVSYKAV